MSKTEWSLVVRLCVPVIPTLVMLRQEDPCQFRLAWTTKEHNLIKERERECVNQGLKITWRECLAIALSFNRALAKTCHIGVQEGQGKRLVYSGGGWMGTGGLCQAQLDGRYLHTFLVDLDSSREGFLKKNPMEDCSGF